MKSLNDTLSMAENAVVDGIETQDFKAITDALVHLAETCNAMVPEGRYLALVGTSLELARMQANMAVSGYPRGLVSTTLITEQDALKSLAEAGMWARAGIAIQGLRPTT